MHTGTAAGTVMTGTTLLLLWSCLTSLCQQRHDKLQDPCLEGLAPPTFQPAQSHKQSAGKVMLFNSSISGSTAVRNVKPTCTF